jgi:hypothetical protein
MAATWIRQELSGYQVQAAVNLNGSWTAPVFLSQEGQNAFESSVAIDRQGIATTVWTAGDIIMAASNRPLSPDNWEAPIALSARGIIATTPRVMVDTAGNVTALWVRTNAKGVSLIESAHRDPRGTWNSPLVVATAAPRDLMLVINEAGNAAVIWSVGSSLSTSIYVSTRPSLSPAGGFVQWSAPYNLAPAAYRQFGPQIGIDQFGNLTACWRSNTTIKVADKLPGGQWTAAQTVYGDNSLSASPTLAIMPSGDAMIAWTEAVPNGGSYNYQISSMSRPAGANWGAPMLLTGTGEYATELHAATNSSGLCLLTWVDVNSSSIKAMGWHLKSGWFDYGTVASGFDTALAISGKTAVTVWIGGSFQTQAATAPIQW